MQAAEGLWRYKNNLGLWCSIGISEKISFKDGIEMKTYGYNRIMEKIFQKALVLQVNAMCGIGAKTAQVLNSMGIRTIGELGMIRTYF